MMNTNDYKKWLIPSTRFASRSYDEEKAAWDEEHKDYSKNIFSVTQDPSVCKTLIRPSNQPSCFNIPDSPEIQVLIPGCGSEIYLQKTLLEFCPQIGQIYCTDYSRTAIELAKNNWQQVAPNSRLDNQQVVFEELDSTRLTEQKSDWTDKFDYVLVANSVISSEDNENRQMIREFYNVLKPGGKLYGFFPTIFAELEIAYLSKAKAHYLTDGSINLPYSAFYDNRTNDRQIMYTPLRLNRIFKEVGFKRLSFEIFFTDSAVLAANFKQIYEIDEPDIYDWLQLVRLEKKAL